MSKRRTKREKLKAHHQFNLSSLPSLKKAFTKASVKSQNIIGEGRLEANNEYNKSAISSGNVDNLKAVKRDIIKSIILVSFILALEVVIYLAVNFKGNLNLPWSFK